MCEVVNENEGDAIQAYAGNKSAGLRFRKALREIEILCVEMRNALFEQPLRKTAVKKQKPQEQGEGAEGAQGIPDGAKEDGAEGQSDDGQDDVALDDDLDREPDSDPEADLDTARPLPQSLQSDTGNEVREFQFLKERHVKDNQWAQMKVPQGLQEVDARVSVEPDVQRTPAHTEQPTTVLKSPTLTPVLTPQYENSKWPPAVVFLDRQ